MTCVGKRQDDRGSLVTQFVCKTRPILFVLGPFCEKNPAMLFHYDRRVGAYPAGR